MHAVRSEFAPESRTGESRSLLDRTLHFRQLPSRRPRPREGATEPHGKRAQPYWSVVSTVWRSSPLSEEELSELPECVLRECPVRRAESGVTFRTEFWNAELKRGDSSSWVMHIIVHVRNKPIAVSVGEPGLQPVRWLANVGTARYDSAQGRCLGFPVGVRLEDGSLLGLNQSLAEAGLRDMQHVWVVYKGGGSDE